MEPAAGGGASDLGDVWQAIVGARKAEPLPANDGRRSGQADAHVWHLPDLWGRLFSRLYEELGLVSGGMTPRAEETLVRLGSWMPFEPAREVLEDLLGGQGSQSTPPPAALATGRPT